MRRFAITSMLLALAAGSAADPAPEASAAAAAPTSTQAVTETGDEAHKRAPGLVDQGPYTLVGERNFLDGYAAAVSDSIVNAVIEIPTGSVDKWEVKNEDGLLHWDFKNGKPRKVRYLGYPLNYGMVPRTVQAKARGGDGDPLDILVLGAAAPRGAVIEARVIGLFRMQDKGELDVKLVAVRAGTAFENLRGLTQLAAEFPGVTSIVETWFANYKGPGVVQTQGFGDVDEALEVLRAAVQDYAAAHPGP